MTRSSDDSPAATTALLLEGVSFRYPDGVEALRQVSLRIAEGEKVALVGPNGSGKSTLLRQINGLLVPTQGTVCVAGMAVRSENLVSVRRRVGYVFQDPDDQLFCPTVLEDVAFGPQHLGLSTEHILRCVGDALSAVGLTGYERRVPHKLSAGEKALVALATVLSYSPKLLIMDEPSAALDPRNRRLLLSVLARLAGTQLVATHDLDFAWELCERTILLCEGAIIADGPTREILSDRPLLEQHGLELPLRLQGANGAGA